MQLTRSGFLLVSGFFLGSLCFRILADDTGVTGDGVPTPPEPSPTTINYTVISSFFQKLESVKDDFTNDVALYNSTANALLAGLNTLMAVQQQRKDLYTCLTTSFNNLLASVNACQSNKQAIINQFQTDQANLLSQINSLTNQTNTEIADLNTLIASLNDQINALNTNIGTLVQMDANSAQKALADLTEAQALYTTSVVSRQAFLSQLNTLLDKVVAYDYLANKYSGTVASLICQQ